MSNRLRFRFRSSAGGAASPAPVNTVAPAITGNAYVGSTLTCSTGTWSFNPLSYAYQWKADAGNVGTNQNTYVPVTGDIGKVITCVVTATNVTGSTPATSNATAAVIAVPANTVIPAITGTAADGSTLTSSTGTWSGGGAPTYAYQWKSAGSNVGTNQNTYLIQTSDVGNTITVTVTATNAAGTGTPAVSNATGVVVAVDPSFASVILLMQPGGSNGGTTFTDLSPVARTLTASTGAITSTTQQQFSLASMFTNNGNPADSVTAVATSRIIPATAAFCVELFFYSTSFAADQCMTGQWTSVAPNLQWSMWITGGAHDQFSFFGSVSGSDVFTLAQEAAGAISINTWYYGCFDWDGSKYRLFRGIPGGNANMVASSATPRTIASNTARFTMGCHANQDSAGFKGYIAQHRITNATRHGSDSAFAVPTAAFPTS